MRFAIAIAALAFGLLTAPSIAETAAQPWQQATDLLKLVNDDLQKGGLQALQPRVAEIEKALAEAQTGIIKIDDEHGIVLVDGLAETLTAMAAASEAGKQGHGVHQVEALPNPYPMLSFYLGAYYNEVGRFEDAIRVFDRGLSLYFAPTMTLGQSAPLIFNEKAYALTALKRWDDVLALCDEALKLEDAAPENRARSFRNRGYALVELGRFDEAEEAYREALKVLPGDPKSLGELEYIRRLRAKK